jgi:Alcohol dehydrogenase transcription factor Myb/SANT-like
LDEPIDGTLEKLNNEFDLKPLLDTEYHSECSTDSKTAERFVGRTYTEDCTLIKVYKTFPILYNRSHADYKKNYLKERAWRDVAKMTAMSVELVKKRVTFLRCRFSVERRISQNGQTGSDWPLLDRLKFLDKHIKMRKTAAAKRVKSPIPVVTKKEDLNFTPPYNFQADLPLPLQPLVTQETSHSMQSSQSLAERRDEHQIFGEYVAEVLRKLNNAPETTLRLMKVLVEAQHENEITSQTNNNS